MPKLIRDRLLEAFRADDMNASVLSRRTTTEGDEGIGEKTIDAIIKNPGRCPTAHTLECIARGLGDNHEQYYEWPMAEARRDAAANPKAVRKRAAGAARKAAQRRSVKPQEPQADPNGNPDSGQAT